MSISPTQRTLRANRDMGRACWIVERFNPYAGPHSLRRDLFGIIDVLALDPQLGVIGIQSCGQDFSDHRRKILEERYQEKHKVSERAAVRAFLQAAKAHLPEGDPILDDAIEESLREGVRRNTGKNQTALPVGRIALTEKTRPKGIQLPLHLSLSADFWANTCLVGC